MADNEAIYLSSRGDWTTLRGVDGNIVARLQSITRDVRIELFYSSSTLSSVFGPKYPGITYYARQGRYVMPGVCLSVCLLASLRKNYWTDLHKNFTTDVPVHKEELIKLWKSSASGCGSRNVWRIIQHCEIGHFSTICLISPEKLTGFSWRKYYCRCIVWQGSTC